MFQNSWTPLLVATSGCFVDVVRALLEHDPNINATDKVELKFSILLFSKININYLVFCEWEVCVLL